MNRLQERGYLKEKNCGACFSYILQDESLFLPTEYKVMQNETEAFLVRCMKMHYNGKLQLYYMTGEYKKLSAVIRTLEPSEFLTVVSNLLDSVIAVRNVGFLSCQKLALDFGKIFVEPGTYRVKLLYLPIKEDLGSDYEYRLRDSLVKLVGEYPALQAAPVMVLVSDLQSGMKTLEDLADNFRNNKYDVGACQERNRLFLVGVDTPVEVEFVIEKNDFTLGKKADAVDGCLSFSDLISRRHCRIQRSEGNFAVMDLQSVNGTYINQQRLEPYRPYPLKDGDILRLAKSSFQVTIR